MVSPAKKISKPSSEIISSWREHKCKGVVYLITCVAEQKSYVGITRRPLKQRFQGHKKQAEKGQGDYASLQEALRTYGDDSFKYEILAEAKTLGELSDKEVLYIDELNTLTPAGYNKNRGGSVAIGSHPFFFQNEQFQSIADLADYYDIYEETLRKRLSTGWSMPEAVGLEERPKVKIKGKRYEIAQKKFISQATLCEHFEISLVSFRSRLSMGWSLEESLGLEERERKNQYVVAGLEYKTLVDVCERYELNKSKIESRLRNGVDLETAVFTEQLSGNRTPIKVDGIDFDSIADAARHFQIEPSKVRGRLKSGYGVRIAFGLENIPKLDYRKKARKDFIVDGVMYSSFGELERAFSINKDTIRAKLDRGVSLLDALKMPVRKAKRYNLGDKSFTVSELSERFQIGRQTIEYRLSKNWSAEQAVGLEKKLHSKKTAIVLEGKEFNSKRAAALHYGIKLPTIYSRMNYGYSLEEAFGLKSREALKVATVYVVTKEGESWVINNIKKFAKHHRLNKSFISNILVTMSSDKNHMALGYSIRKASLSEQKIFYDLPENNVKEIGFNSHSHQLIYKGTSYKSKSALCEHFGLKVGNFYAFYDELQDIDLTMKKLLENDRKCNI
jgi:hypothetical protein